LNAQLRTRIKGRLCMMLLVDCLSSFPG